jgi:hypothetical protein
MWSVAGRRPPPLHYFVTGKGLLIILLAFFSLPFSSARSTLLLQLPHSVCHLFFSSLYSRPSSVSYPTTPQHSSHPSSSSSQHIVMSCLRRSLLWQSRGVNRRRLSSLTRQMSFFSYPGDKIIEISEIFFEHLSCGKEKGNAEKPKIAINLKKSSN